MTRPLPGNTQKHPAKMTMWGCAHHSSRCFPSISRLAQSLTWKSKSCVRSWMRYIFIAGEAVTCSLFCLVWFCFSFFLEMWQSFRRYEGSITDVGCHEWQMTPYPALCYSHQHPLQFPDCLQTFIAPVLMILFLLIALCYPNIFLNIFTDQPLYQLFYEFDSFFAG